MTALLYGFFCGVLHQPKTSLIVLHKVLQESIAEYFVVLVAELT